MPDIKDEPPKDVNELVDRLFNKMLAAQPWVTGQIHDHIDSHKQDLKKQLQEFGHS